MAATVTLATTTLQANVGQFDSQIKPGSTSGMAPGVRLFLDGELMTVISLDPGSLVSVRRGQDGSSTQAHASTATVYIGRADQFFSQDPIGTPAAPVAVSPYINVVNGSVWFAQGDEAGPGTPARFWQKVTTTPDIGALGVRTSTAAPTGPA